MAGDWIPVRARLKQEPEVLLLAERTGKTVHEVMGLMVDFWGWISEVSDTGRILSASVRTVCAAVGGDEAFWGQVEAVGWFEGGDGVGMPRFDSWLSKGAKRRLKEAQRKRFERSAPHKKTSASCPHDCGQKADQRRGEERTSSPPTPPQGDGVGDEEKTGTKGPEAIAGEVLEKARALGERRLQDFTRAAEDFNASIEEAWKVYAGLLQARRTGRAKIEDIGAYVAHLRKTHRHPRELMPEIDQEISRRREGEERGKLLEELRGTRIGCTFEGAKGTITIKREGLELRKPGKLGGSFSPWSMVPTEELNRILAETAPRPKRRAGNEGRDHEDHERKAPSQARPAAAS